MGKCVFYPKKQRFWSLRRLSSLGASRDTLLNQYHLRIRCLLEMACPVFTAGLSKTNIEDIEDVQKGVFRIILHGNYSTYQAALRTLGEESLEHRRNTICLKFAKQSLSHPKMSHLFKKRDNNCTVCPEGCSRSGAYFTQKLSKSSRGYNSPVNFLTRLLNNNMNK